MIEKIFIISFIVFAINFTLQTGSIFGRLGDKLSEILPPILHNPVFECVICMTPWYGSAIYWIIWRASIEEMVIVVISATGLNYIISKLLSDG